MKKPFDRRRAGLLCLGLGLLVFTIACNGVLNHRYFVDVFLNYDSAGEILLARQVALDGRWVYSENWYYSTELRTLHNQLVMAPLFRLGGSALWVHWVSTVVLNTLTALAGVACLWLLGTPLWASLLGGALVASPFSYELFNTSIANNYYSFFVICTLLFAAAFLRLLAARPGRRSRALWVALAAGGFVLGLCGMRYLVILFAPLGLLMLGLVMRRADQGLLHGARGAAAKAWDPALRAAAGYLGSLASYAAGFVVYEKLLRPHFGVMDYAAGFRFSQRQYIIEKFFRLGEALMGVFTPLYSENLLSVIGLAELAGLLAVLCMVAASVYLVAVRDRLPHLQRYFVAFAWLSLGVSALVIVLLDDAFGPSAVISERYLLLGAYPLLLLPALALGQAVQARRRGAASTWGQGTEAASPAGGKSGGRRADRGILSPSCRVALAVAIAASLVSNPLSLWQLCGVADDPNGGKSLVECTAFLQENGYEYGFGVYSAGAVEVLSDFAIQATGVVPDEDSGGFVPHHWLQSKASYAVNYGQERQFLLLRQSDVIPPGLAEAPLVFENRAYKILQVAPGDVLPREA